MRFEIDVTDARLFQLYEEALAVYYGPFDEDYGYVTLEGFAADRPVVTLADSGGPLEFVADGETGLVAPPEPKAIADAFDRLFVDRDLAGATRARPATRSSAPRSRAGPTSSRGCSTDAPRRRPQRSDGAAAPAAPGSVGELVFSGPLPPARTGVATYDRAVLDGLRRIGFFDRHRMDVLWPIEPKDTPRLPGYRLGVFELGNNVEFHLEVYRAAFLAQASLIVLHDLALDDFVRALRTLGDPLGFMATREAAALRPNLSSPDVVRNEPLREPWCAHVARRARGIIVHSAFCKAYLEEFGCRTPVFVVPHPIVESDADMRAAVDRGRELRAAARGARHALARRGARRPERGEAARRRARRRARARRRRARRAGRPPHRGLRHRSRRGRPRGSAIG